MFKHSIIRTQHFLQFNQVKVYNATGNVISHLEWDFVLILALASNHLSVCVCVFVDFLRERAQAAK